MNNRDTGAGKGDSPRNLSEQFRVNYDLIDWDSPPNNPSPGDTWGAYQFCEDGFWRLKPATQTKHNDHARKD